MESIKANIRGDGVDSSVEFSVDEVIAHHHDSKPWADMNDADQEAAMKDYALELFSRQTGQAGNLHVNLERGTFSRGGPI